jgi:hypothetical protein
MERSLLKEERQMRVEDKYFRTLSQDELWQRYCGFLDLSADRFIEIQKSLLMDEIELVSDSVLGKKIMKNRKPKTVEEFRSIVPLTSHDDYEPYLGNRQDDALAVKPAIWCHSSGTGGYFKWVPHSREILDKAVRYYLAICILASCDKKGEVNIRPGFRFLTVVAPQPYASGFVVPAFLDRFSAKLMPPDEQTRTTDLRERIQKGFQMGLREGVDIIGALASLLVRMGEEVGGQARSMKPSLSMLHPKLLFRLVQAWLRSKIERRGILPKDLWRPKGIIVSGLDTAIYKEDVAYYWGRLPYELYTGTEGLVYAVQDWNKNELVFVPDMVFLEFIPYEELRKLQEDKKYQPATVLLNELKEGELYEIVITQLYGMPLLRYRIKDLIKVVAVRDEKAGINLPKIAFQRRTDEVINLAALCQLDEKTIWQAITNTEIKYGGWTACKEYDGGRTFLRIYLELNEDREPDELALMIDNELKIVDTDYKDIGAYLGLQPVRITLLSPGTFQRYVEEKIKEGADLAQLKPAHVNPPNAMIQRLLKLSEQLSKI